MSLPLFARIVPQVNVWWPLESITGDPYFEMEIDEVSCRLYHGAEVADF